MSDEEEPLDPAVEAVRVKMVRLLAVSGGIMMLGLMAVLLAIVYKVNQDVEPKAAAKVTPNEATLAIPAGFTGDAVQPWGKPRHLDPAPARQFDANSGL